MKINDVYCYSCNKKLDIISEQKVLRNQECDYCQTQLHCCKMCIHYDISAYNDCREPTAERIVDKEKANFCGHYKIIGGTQSQDPSKDELLNAAEKLFKN